MLPQRGSRGCCCKASSGLCQRLCSHGTGFLHFLQRKLLNSLYLMFKWTTGTETPAPSFPCSKEQQEQQAQAVSPASPQWGQEGNASPAPLPQAGQIWGIITHTPHLAAGNRTQHWGSTSTTPQPGQNQPRGQQGWVIQGTATLISSQTSRITACEGCLESSNMVSVPTASQGCSTTALQGLTQPSCSSGIPREGLWERSQLGLAMGAWDTHPAWPHSPCRNPATRMSCLKTAFAAASLEFSPPSPSPCSTGISTKRQGSIMKRFICSRRFKSPLCASQQGQQSPAPVRQRSPLGLAQSQSHFHTELTLICLLNNFSTRWLELICDLGWDGSCWQVPPLNHHEQIV